MSKKPMKNISEITEQWVKEGCPSAKPQDAWKVKDRLNEALTLKWLTKLPHKTFNISVNCVQKPLERKFSQKPKSPDA